MIKFAGIMAASLLFVSGAAVAGGDAAAGKTKAAMCAGCHGANGISNVPTYPNLAGQKQQYLVMTLKGFKSGERSNATMKAMAAGLSDADIENLAAYYSSLK